jgi:hypothetical protein
MPINRYGTTLGGMINSIYDNSPFDAIKDLVDNDEELTLFRDFQPYDMNMSPLGTWKQKDGTMNKELARQATKTLLKKKQEVTGLPFEQLLPTITQEDFYMMPIN